MDTKEYVMSLLKQHNKMAQEVASLQYELEHFIRTDDEAIIQELSFPGGMGEYFGTGDFSDRTADIALKYRQMAEQVNSEALKSVIHRLNVLKTTVDRLDYYIGQLEKEQAEVLRLYYFKRLSWRELQEQMNMAVKTLRKLRDVGLDRLVERYGLLLTLSVITVEDMKILD